MGTIREGLTGAGYRESSPEEQETNAEKQRIVKLLLNPKNRFRVSIDFFYTPEKDPRFLPENLNKKPFRDIVYEDWQRNLAENKSKQKFDATNTEENWKTEFEQEWLTEHNKDELIANIQEWIDVESDENVKQQYEEYLNRYRSTIERYENLQATKTASKLKNESDPNRETSKFLGAKPGFRNPNANKWFEGLERVDEPRFAKAKAQFKLIIEQDFNSDYKKFLDSGTFTPVANKAELGLTIALNFVAQEALLNQGKITEFEEYKKFLELPKEKQVEFFTEQGIDVDGKTVLALLIKRIKLLLESKTQNTKKVVLKPVRDISPKPEPQESQTEIPVVIDYGFKPSEGLNKMINRIRKQSQNNDYDPDSEIGL